MLLLQFEDWDRSGFDRAARGAGLGLVLPGFLGHLQAREVGGLFATLLFDIINAARDRPALAAIEQRGFFSDEALIVGVETSLVKGAPAESIIGFNDFVEGLAFAFTHRDRVL